MACTRIPSYCCDCYFWKKTYGQAENRMKNADLSEKVGNYDSDKLYSRDQD